MFESKVGQSERIMPMTEGGSGGGSKLFVGTGFNADNERKRAASKFARAWRTTPPSQALSEVRRIYGPAGENPFNLYHFFKLGDAPQWYLDRQAMVWNSLQVLEGLSTEAREFLYQVPNLAFSEGQPAISFVPFSVLGMRWTQRQKILGFFAPEADLAVFEETLSELQDQWINSAPTSNVPRAFCVEEAVDLQGRWAERRLRNSQR